MISPKAPAAGLIAIGMQPAAEPVTEAATVPPGDAANWSWDDAAPTEVGS